MRAATFGAYQSILFFPFNPFPRIFVLLCIWNFQPSVQKIVAIRKQPVFRQEQIIDQRL